MPLLARSLIRGGRKVTKQLKKPVRTAENVVKSLLNGSWKSKQPLRLKSSSKRYSSTKTAAAQAPTAAPDRRRMLSSVTTATLQAAQSAPPRSLAAAAAAATIATIGLAVTNGDTLEILINGEPQDQEAEAVVLKSVKEAKRNPYTSSIAAAQGLRCAMEDHYKMEMGGRFAGVFDGHRGASVSEFLRNQIWSTFRQNLVKRVAEDHADFITIEYMTDALKEALLEIEQKVSQDPVLSREGSTAVAVVMHTDAETKERTLISANCGDSRAILSRNGKSIDLTEDHKPNLARETARIESLGGKVEWDNHGELYRVQTLALSRCIGDAYAKPIVSGEPDMQQFTVSGGDDEFFLMASDGLWDVMSSQEVVDFVHSIKDTVPLHRIADAVAKEAMMRNTSDNVCVVMVWLD